MIGFTLTSRLYNKYMISPAESQRAAVDDGVLTLKTPSSRSISSIDTTVRDFD
jgi:hypothetical protein